MFETQFRSFFKHFSRILPSAMLAKAKNKKFTETTSANSITFPASLAANSLLAVYFSYPIPCQCHVVLHRIATVFAFALKYRVFEGIAYSNFFRTGTLIG
ncbi:MAG: hypothetical protein HYR92_02020 [Burkholderiales bacterium]|nr:hypothetical protein [Burkholderiales bacterium]